MEFYRIENEIKCPPVKSQLKWLHWVDWLKCMCVCFFRLALNWYVTHKRRWRVWMRGKTNKIGVINKPHYDRGSHIVISTSAATLVNKQHQNATGNRHIHTRTPSSVRSRCILKWSYSIHCVIFAFFFSFIFYNEHDVFVAIKRHW